MKKLSVVESIKSKVDKLITENIKLRGLGDVIATRELKLKDENRELHEEIALLQKRIGILELRDGMAGNSEDKRLAKVRVNRLMREIDRCIAMMNN